jgi:hypothetical protein
MPQGKLFGHIDLLHKWQPLHALVLSTGALK